MRILTKEKGLGYFGLKYDYRLFGLSILKITREYDFDVIKIISLIKFKKRRNHNQIYPTYDNSLILKKIKETRLKKIVFIVNSLQSVGGVESRLEKLFKFIKSENWLPILLVEENTHPRLREEMNLICVFSAPDSVNNINKLMEEIEPEVVEFQFKSTKLFHGLNDDFFNKKYLAGACIHEEISVDNVKLKKLDYFYSSAKRQCLSEINNYKIIPNWISFRNNPLWTFKQQKMALIVSRISMDKIQTIINFIDFCESADISYEIAGDFKQQRNKKTFNILLKKGVPRKSFIGKIDTEDFLIQNLDKYLFVAGVGQVAIESVSVGYPFMVSAHYGKYKNSVFLNGENLSELKESNFTIKDSALHKYSNTDDFISLIKQGLSPEAFIPFEEMKAFCDDRILSEYKTIINMNGIESHSPDRAA